MKIWHVLSLSALVTIIGSGGCEPENDVGALVDDYIAEVNEQYETYCDCYQELGWASRSQCISGQDSIGPSQRRCLQDAFDGGEDASQQYLECIVPLAAELNTCIHSRLSCGDFDLIDPCLDDYDIGRASCIELPVNVMRDLGVCQPE